MADSFTVDYGKAASSDWEFGLGRDISVSGVDELKLKLHTMVPEVRKALEQVIGAKAQEMRDRAIALASGQVIQERTGKFVASIKSELRSTETSVMGDVYSDDPRAPLFEYGGEQQPRDILPNIAQALRFLGGSAGTVFAAMVHRPVVTYPARSEEHTSELQSH